MYVNVMVGEKALSDSQVNGIRPYPGERRLHGFLHDLADLAGHGEPTFPTHHIGFDEQHIAASRSPREADRNAGAFRALSDFAFTADLDPPEKFLNDFLSNHQLLGLALS